MFATKKKSTKQICSKSNENYNNEAFNCIYCHVKMYKENKRANCKDSQRRS